MLTLYFFLNSLHNGAVMILRRTLEGAVKCAFRDFLLELLTSERTTQNQILETTCDTGALQDPKLAAPAPDLHGIGNGKCPNGEIGKSEASTPCFAPEETSLGNESGSRCA